MCIQLLCEFVMLSSVLVVVIFLLRRRNCDNLMLGLQAKGGGLSFLQGNSPSFQQSSWDGKSPQALLAYINADHEYILFDPYDNDAVELSVTRRKDRIAVDVTGGLLYRICCFIMFLDCLKAKSFSGHYELQGLV